MENMGDIKCEVGVSRCKGQDLRIVCENHFEQMIEDAKEEGREEMRNEKTP